MSKFLNYKGVSIHFSDAGKGEAIVLLHGFLEDISMWNHLQKTLIKTNRVICIDLLGHGKSECLGYVHTMETMAESVKFVLDSLNIDKAKFIGHSMGGYVALALAEKHNNIIDSLCLMNSTAQEDSEERKALRTRAIEMAKRNYEPLVSMSVANLFSQTTRLNFLVQIDEAKQVALKTPVQGYIACTEGMKLRKNREQVLSSAKFKTLIIAGKNDPVLSYNSIVKEAERTNTNIVSFPNGHMSHIENAAELEQEVLVFIKD